MSRFSKRLIAVPSGVQVSLDGGVIVAKGPAGEVRRQLSGEVAVSQGEGGLSVKPARSDKAARAMAGTYWRLIAAMIEGAHQGFERRLDLSGVGYRAQAKGDEISLQLGFSHPVSHKTPPGVTAQTPSQTEIVLKGADKQAVGQLAANLRAYRPPEPYKGKGVRHRGERVVLKETKKK